MELVGFSGQWSGSSARRILGRRGTSRPVRAYHVSKNQVTTG